jgi:hypothetical protein
MHIQFTLYSTIVLISYSKFIDPLSLYTIATFILIHQWFYLSCLNEPFSYNEPSQYCDRCEKMTPQSFIHCKHCKRCVPVLNSHSFLLNKCCDTTLIRRYIILMKMTIILYIALTIIAALNYPLISFAIIIHLTALQLVSLKSQNPNYS